MTQSASQSENETSESLCLCGRTSHDLITLGVWTDQEQKIYQAIEDGFTNQFFASYEDKVHYTLDLISKSNVSKENATKFILKTIETELGTKFTASQKRKFTDALSAAWDVGTHGSASSTPSKSPTLDFNKTAKKFFETIFKVDVGGQFKDNKNDFLSTIKEALDTGDTKSAIKALEEKLLGKRNKSGKLSDKSELRDKLEYVIRDNIYRAQSFSRTLTMQEEGIYRVEFVAIIDERTSEICKALNGKSVELKTVNTYIQNFLADDPERAGFWNERKNPTNAAVSALGFDKMTGDEILSNLGHQAPPFHIRCRTTIVASVNIVARTVREAQNIAKLQFGVTADYGNNLSLANHINAGLRAAKEVGMKMPANILFNPTKVKDIFGNDAGDVPAAFLEPKNSPSGETTILVNDTNSYWLDPKGSAIKDYETYISSTDNEHHAFLHEMAHLEHYSTNEALYRNKATFTDANLIKRVSSEVSERASYDSRELVAEIKLGLQSGKKYPNDLMELYNKFGGN